MDIIDYTNTVIGPMTVIKRVPIPDYYRTHRYECKCVCGGSFLMTSNGVKQSLEVKENYVSKCACRWPHSLSQCEKNITLSPQMIVGDITLIKPAPTPDNVKRKSHKYYLGKCICGNEKSFSEDLLKKNIRYGFRKKIPLSCGCGIYNKHKSIPINYIKRIKEGAVSRNIEYNVSIELLSDLYEKQNRKCKLTGLPIPFHCDPSNFTKKTFASLDRIISSNGYVEGNVQWIHKDYNMLKNSWDNEDFIEMCKRVADHNR